MQHVFRYNLAFTSLAILFTGFPPSIVRCQQGPPNAKAREQFPDSFSAGLTISGFPGEILGICAMRPIVHEDRQHAAVEIDGGNGKLATHVYIGGLTVDSILAIGGKVFRITRLGFNGERDLTHPEIDFKAAKEPELTKLISNANDTAFLPIDCRVEFRYVKSRYVVAPNATREIPMIVASFERDPDMSLAPRITDEQKEQRVGVGDTIRYGKYGLKVRNIVLPDPEKKILGWVEVFDKELVFENEDAK